MHTNVQERKDRVRTKQACGAPFPHSLSPNLLSLGHRLSQILLPEDINFLSHMTKNTENECLNNVG